MCLARPPALHCKRARQYLDDVPASPTATTTWSTSRAPLAEMLARVKPIIGAKTPVTVPQVWLDGTYIGGADQLSARLQRSVEPNRSAGATPCRQPRAKRLWRAQVPLRVGRSAFALSNAFFS